VAARRGASIDAAPMGIEHVILTWISAFVRFSVLKNSKQQSSDYHKT
jgi:hypothetical protein